MRWAETRIRGTTERQVAETFTKEQPAQAQAQVGTFRIAVTANGGCTSMVASKSGGVLRPTTRPGRPTHPRAMEQSARLLAGPESGGVIPETAHCRFRPELPSA